MKQQALAILEKARAAWAGMSKARKITVAIVAASLVTAVATLWAVSSQQTYDYLFTDLSTEDAAAVVGKLGELKIPYKVEAGGSAILVPAEKVHEVRLQVAGAGLPRGAGVGFELFDKTKFGTTEFEQQVNLRRALEGELARTISTISSVKSARVHLALPERSVFLRNRDPASASVILQLHPERTFGKRETQAVLHLVSSAVPGLTQDRISLVTTDGTTLHGPTDGQSGSMMGETLVDREVEAAGLIESRVRALLERAVGSGHADVRVRVELDSSTSEHTEERYPKGTIRSQQEMKEGGSLDDRPASSGIPGVRSNLPEVASAAPAGSQSPDDQPAPLAETEAVGGSGVIKHSRTTNWEVDRVTEKRMTPAGNIKRLTVAVMVDGVRKPLAGGGQEYVDRSPEEITRLAALVKGAVGYDEARGDAVEVASVRFYDPADLATAEAPPASVASKWLRWPYLAGAAGVGALALAAGAWRWSRRRKADKALAPAGAEPLALGTEEPAPELAGAEAPALPARSEEETARVREQAVDLALRDPATAAVILREWLNAAPAIPPPAATAPELPPS
jgi:flagellar M-ring protein FliF